MSLNVSTCRCRLPFCTNAGAELIAGGFLLPTFYHRLAHLILALYHTLLHFTDGPQAQCATSRRHLCTRSPYRTKNSLVLAFFKYVLLMFWVRNYDAAYWISVSKSLSLFYNHWPCYQALYASSTGRSFASSGGTTCGLRLHSLAILHFSQPFWLSWSQKILQRVSEACDAIESRQ